MTFRDIDVFCFLNSFIDRYVEVRSQARIESLRAQSAAEDCESIGEIRRASPWLVILVIRKSDHVMIPYKTCFCVQVVCTYIIIHHYNVYKYIYIYYIYIYIYWYLIIYLEFIFQIRTDVLFGIAVLCVWMSWDPPYNAQDLRLGRFNSMRSNQGEAAKPLFVVAMNPMTKCHTQYIYTNTHIHIHMYVYI